MAFRICHKSTCFVEKKNGVETERKRLLSYASCLKDESFEFVFLLILQDKILQIVNTRPKRLQSVTMDLFTAKYLLKTALADVSALRDKFLDLKLEASALCQKLGIDDQFPEKRNRQAKRHFDELAVDHWFNDPEELFRIKMFLPMIDTVVTQLDTRFEGTQRIAQKYKVVQPKF